MKRKKSVLKCIIIGVVAFAMIWSASIIKCEVLTYRYGYEFSDAWKENTMLGEQEYWKVLKYTDIYAEVYFVAVNHLGGDVLTFSRDSKNDAWEYVNWETVWSKTGSADGVIWPYIR